MTGRCVLLTLPDETLVSVLRYLHFPDLISLSESCKSLHRLCGDDSLWRWQCQHYFLNNECTEGQSWRNHFINWFKDFGKYPDYRDFKLAWDKIKKFLKNNCIRIYNELLDGAHENDFTELKGNLDQPLPLDFELSYRLCNGQNYLFNTPGLLGGFTLHNFSSTYLLLPLSQISEEVELDTDVKDLGLIPFARSTQSDMYYYAYSDCACFTPGHVYFNYATMHGLGEYDEFFCAGSFKDFITDYANKLQSNEYYVKDSSIYKFYHEPDCIATTSGITVKASVCFVPELSRKPSFFFAYRITLSMSKDTPRELSCQLETRHWVITDGNGREELVNGPGVVGEHPIMKPGAEFSWISCCTFNTPTGNTKGYFRFRNLASGEPMDIECPRYHMKAMPVLTKDNRATESNKR